MKFKAYFIFLLFVNSIAIAGTWSRVEPKAIRFEGQIVKGDLENLVNLLKSQDDTVYVKSTGGDTEVGLALAEFLLPLKLTIIVDGYCASSCANYLFTSAYKKEIKVGWVGFHGNVTALLSKDWEQTAKELKEKYGLTDQQIENFYNHQTEVSRAEQSYLKRIGVSQELFDRTQSDDKGMHDGNDYTFLCPKPETFEKYGIQNVSGEQEITYGNFSELKNILD